MNATWLERACGTPLVRLLWGFVIAVGICLVALRVVAQYHTPGVHHELNQGFCDFHNGVYYPAVAYTHGVSPFGRQYVEQYPVARQLPPYSPLIVALHTPLAVLPLAVAEVVYFGIMLLCIILMAWVIVTDAPGLSRWCMLPIVAMLVWFRSGHVTLYNGYFTFELVLGMLVALSFARTRPWVAAFGFAVATTKPTYAIPLLLLMAARGDWRTLWRGCVLDCVGGAASLVWLTGWTTIGVRELVSDMQAATAVHMAEPLELPVDSWTRIDLLTVVAKAIGRNPSDLIHLLTMLPLLCLPVAVLWVRRRQIAEPGATGLTGGLIITASLMALYHHAYDAMLLLAPLVGFLANRWPEARSHRWLDRTIAVLLLFPQVNLLSTASLVNRFDLDRVWFQVVTSSNAVAVALACGLLTWRLARLTNGSTGDYDSPASGD